MAKEKEKQKEKPQRNSYIKENFLFAEGLEKKRQSKKRKSRK